MSTEPSEVDVRVMYAVRLLQQYARSNWSGPPATLPEIPVFASVVLGDISRAARSVIEGGYSRDARQDAAEELGNLILSSLRWIDDLGLEITSCLEAAAERQRNYGRESDD